MIGVMKGVLIILTKYHLSLGYRASVLGMSSTCSGCNLDLGASVYSAHDRLCQLYIRMFTMTTVLSSFAISRI